jgi:rod shape determining protein RodA
MSYLEYNVKYVPTGFRKLLYLNWPLILLICAVCATGFLMLYSIAGGSMDPWARDQIERFGLGLVAMFTVALTPIWFWRNMAVMAYLVALAMLVGVEIAGDVRMGAQRWIDLGFIRIQPSEVMKIALVMVLAAYYDWLPAKRTSHPLWVLAPLILIALPVVLVLGQPNLGTALLILMVGGAMMFLAGVHWLYFVTVIGSVVATISAVFQSRGTSWQLLHDYQFRRIDTFLDPTSDPLGAGYNITQATIALGSGGWTGRGFMQGTQSRLNFLPEKETDFIFNTLAEEFGFLGTMTLLILYVMILVFCFSSALQNKDRFASLLTLGVATSFFGLIQSAHVHRPR